MVTGDLGYQDAFGLSYEAVGDDQEITSNILYPETANFIWVVFLVLIPILLTNMLVSTAVQIACSMYVYVYCQGCINPPEARRGHATSHTACTEGEML